MVTILVDTGILYAMADLDDAWHEPVKAFLKNMTDVLAVPITVLPENRKHFAIIRPRHCRSFDLLP